MQNQSRHLNGLAQICCCKKSIFSKTLIAWTIFHSDEHNIAPLFSNWWGNLLAWHLGASSVELSLKIEDSGACSLGWELALVVLWASLWIGSFGGSEREVVFFFIWYISWFQECFKPMKSMKCKIADFEKSSQICTFFFNFHTCKIADFGKSSRALMIFSPHFGLFICNFKEYQVKLLLLIKCKSWDSKWQGRKVSFFWGPRCVCVCVWRGGSLVRLGLVSNNGALCHSLPYF